MLKRLINNVLKRFNGNDNEERKGIMLSEGETYRLQDPTEHAYAKDQPVKTPTELSRLVSQLEEELRRPLCMHLLGYELHAIAQSLELEAEEAERRLEQALAWLEAQQGAEPA